MRLIDADRLLSPGYTDMWDEPIKFDMISRYAIESEPTVDAIPIEWIEEYWNVKDEIITYDVFTVRNNEQEVHCSIPVRTKCVQQLINDMLEDWEKENEAN